MQTLPQPDITSSQKVDPGKKKSIPSSWQELTPPSEYPLLKGYPYGSPYSRGTINYWLQQNKLKLKPCEILIMWRFLFLQSWETGELDISNQSLVDEFQYSLSTVKRSMRSLEQRGLIERRIFILNTRDITSKRRQTLVNWECFVKCSMISDGVTMTHKYIELKSCTGTVSSPSSLGFGFGCISEAKPEEQKEMDTVVAASQPPTEAVASQPQTVVSEPIHLPEEFYEFMTNSLEQKSDTITENPTEENDMDNSLEQKFGKISTIVQKNEEKLPGMERARLWRDKTKARLESQSSAAAPPAISEENQGVSSYLRTRVDEIMQRKGIEVDRNSVAFKKLSPDYKPESEIESEESNIPGINSDALSRLRNGVSQRRIISAAIAKYKPDLKKIEAARIKGEIERERHKKQIEYRNRLDAERLREATQGYPKDEPLTKRDARLKRLEHIEEKYPNWEFICRREQCSLEEIKERMMANLEYDPFTKDQYWNKECYPDYALMDQKERDSLFLKVYETWMYDNENYHYYSPRQKAMLVNTRKRVDSIGVKYGDYMKAMYWSFGPNEIIMEKVCCKVGHEIYERWEDEGCPEPANHGCVTYQNRNFFKKRRKRADWCKIIEEDKAKIVFTKFTKKVVKKEEHNDFGTHNGTGSKTSGV